MKKDYSKGSYARLEAGRKAAETRKRNRNAGIFIVERKIKVPKISNIKKNKYHEIIIESPVKVYVDNELNRIYISKHQVKVK